jgi:D-alanyl-D-alanine carboxypeptidase
MNKKLLIIILCLIPVGLLVFFLMNKSNGSEVSLAPTVQKEEVKNQEVFNKELYSINQPGSLWWIVNKSRALPDGYIPNDLIVPEVKLRLPESQEQMQVSNKIVTDLKEMFSAAEKEKVVLVFGSGYRSFELQKQFYDSYVSQDGQEAADRYSARPGTSEHQTGLSFDATNVGERCHLEVCFSETPEGKWIKENASKYGFIIRYPEGKEAITGYQYEPWHLRYVGKELATELQKTGQTMEEFFNLN